MIKEIRYTIFLVIIIGFIFFSLKYYFSDTNKKKSYRSLKNIGQKIDLYSQNIPILDNDTKNIIEYSKSTNTKKKKNIFFGN